MYGISFSFFASRVSFTRGVSGGPVYTRANRFLYPVVAPTVKILESLW